MKKEIIEKIVGLVEMVPGISSFAYLNSDNESIQTITNSADFHKAVEYSIDAKKIDLWVAIIIFDYSSSINVATQIRDIISFELKKENNFILHKLNIYIKGIK